MTVLPAQKLSVEEMVVSLAAGLMMFLLPGDAMNQFESDGVCYSFIFIVTTVIIMVLYLIIKRYEAIGTALLTMACAELISVVFRIGSGIVTKGSEYWPKLTEYSIVSMFLLWIIPFSFVLTLRLLSIGGDSNRKRMSFVRFMALSMYALLIIYGIVLIFKLIIPAKPRPESSREMELMIFSRIASCLAPERENGIQYIVWHCIIFAPLSFYLSVLIPRFRVWHAMILGVAIGLGVEALQYLMNTSTACTDDILMYVLGAVLGVCIKRVVDFARSVLTGGRDVCMLSFDFIPVPRKEKGEAQIIEE